MASQSLHEELSELSRRLTARSDAILERWRQAVQADPALTTGPTLSRRQFMDHIPALLAAYERHLRSWEKGERTEASGEEELRAAEHGLERWRQGYQLVEVMREWRHLHLCVLSELERETERTTPEAMRVAQKLLAQVYADGVCESADRYAVMERAEAANRLRELQRALKNYEQMERDRAATWREAAHDLRGNLGIVKTATAILHAFGAPETARTRSLDILHRGVESMHELLDELISLARLEAGQEVREIDHFDVAAILGELSGNMLQQAESRGLSLQYDGPDSFVVQGDAIKVRRIAQNLLLNALNYTTKGFVYIRCLTEDQSDASRWVLCVEDTGPGLTPAQGASLGVGPHVSQASARAGGDTALGADEEGRESGPAFVKGEGIGLSIIKRLCDLLDATIKLETGTGRGSTFLVSFPRNYSA